MFMCIKKFIYIERDRHIRQVKSRLDPKRRRDKCLMAPNKGKFDTPRSGDFAMLKILADSSEFAKNMLLKAATERTIDKP